MLPIMIFKEYINKKNKMDNSLPAVMDINHKYIVVERGEA